MSARSHAMNALTQLEQQLSSYLGQQHAAQQEAEELRRANRELQARLTQQQQSLAELNHQLTLARTQPKLQETDRQTLLKQVDGLIREIDRALKHLEQ